MSANQPTSTNPTTYTPCTGKKDSIGLIQCGGTNAAVAPCGTIPGDPKGSKPYWAQPKNGGPLLGDRKCVVPNTPMLTVPPVVIAESVFARMHFNNLAVGYEPSEGTGLVGLPAWVWVTNSGPGTTANQTVSAAAYGMQVSITATFEGISWSMGDGTTLTGCKIPGTPYEAHFDTSDSPTGCSHRYSAPGSYTITATPHWDVTWRIARLGATGHFQAPVQPTSEHVRFAEAQVLDQ